MTQLDDGKWHAVTMGVFVQLLIDAGMDPAVVFRVLSDGEPDDDGQFVRNIQVMLLPDGYIVPAIRKTGADVHDVLRQFIEKGLMR